MIRMRLQLWHVVLLVVSLALVISSVQAQDDAAYLQHRQKVMQAVGGHMGSIAAIMKNKLPYTTTIVVHAQSLQVTSTVIEDAFKKEITEGKTDSKPDIWQDWDKFVAAAKKMGEESGKLADAAQSGDMAAIGAQVKELGKACGGCHKPFRKPKEERFKR
ncbi:c-type cytochrome [Candidatus Entotheonella palauensis]|uniref:c-type cytochrome n=1 Tax=Candidatus Entotheonella palauensis TaxID=93172 RepID=UPI000B7E40A3|nr:cytochrome c [Candidatus Entotheonella palauensis]